LTQEELKQLFHYDLETGIFKVVDTYTKGMRRGNSAFYAGKIIGISDKLGYLSVNLSGRNYRLHRLAFLYVQGNIPKVVDHINGNPSDNRWVNLRACTQGENRRNQRLDRRNKTGFKGVHFNKEVGKFRAYIRHNYKRTYLGFFDSAEEAYAAYCKSARELHGEFFSEERSRLNPLNPNCIPSNQES
jgi:hypothetical protein